ncbi:hypothetical protein [Kitasatospora sp. NPDC002040]|uniref:hypothetical protein n=1 Tax=Kitasatospora sp. NPDC002040 TaxID=3154661 RepID=UPI0033208D78
MPHPKREDRAKSPDRREPDRKDRGRPTEGKGRGGGLDWLAIINAVINAIRLVLEFLG